MGVDPGDGKTNFDDDDYLGGYRIFAERNRPEGTKDQAGDPIDQPHTNIKVQVSITPIMPEGYSTTVHLKVFDPDYYVDGGPAHTPQDGDPNDQTAGTYNPGDNFGGLGMTPATAQLTFEEDEWQHSAMFLIDGPYAGNNFLVGANPRLSVLNNYAFMPDGKNLYFMEQGQQVIVDPPFRTDNWLTVWRTLWMELDDMVAPDPVADGPFDGAGVGNDDVILDPGVAPIDLTKNSMHWALIEVEALPGEYNVKDATPNDGTGTVEFVHNLTAQISSTKSGPVRDVASEPAFWVIHTIGAYEERTETVGDNKGGDWDPNWEANSWLGWAYQYGADGSNFIFYETIRDRQLNDPLPNPPTPVDVDTLTERVVFHEALHRFLGPHGGDPDTGVADGVMVYDTAMYGTPEANELTPRQIRIINQKEYPK